MATIPETPNLIIQESDIPENLQSIFDDLLRALKQMYQDIADVVNQRGKYTNLRVENGAYGDDYLGNGEANVYVDETNHKLMFRVKYSDGTLKTGEVALT
jgi:hypothetical protein